MFSFYFYLKGGKIFTSRKVREVLISQKFHIYVFTQLPKLPTHWKFYTIHRYFIKLLGNNGVFVCLLGFFTIKSQVTIPWLSADTSVLQSFIQLCPFLWIEHHSLGWKTSIIFSLRK
uniref:Uncharacterized protein n=1 Tax=Cacopsylla melanoneura TaxID=428564 RepID=A0A8D8TMK6_9HEMI